MALLQAIYDKQEDIPEAHRELYEEKDGKWEITGVEGMKTQGDIDRLTTALSKERDEHKEVRDKFKPWAEMDHEQVTKDAAELLESRTKIEALEAEGKQGLDEGKIAELVDQRVASQVNPIQLKLDKSMEDNALLTTKNKEHETVSVNRTISDAVREAATKAKVIPSAMEDVLILSERVFEVDDTGKILTKNNVGVLPGLDPETWLGDMQAKRAHWWPASEGGGAKGSGSGGGFTDNPWSREHWNMTNQGKVVRDQGVDKAEVMAKSAGSKVGGQMPAAPAQK